MEGKPDERWAGAGYAVAAYGWWGLAPAYWKLLSGVPPLEIVSSRVVWSLVFTAPLVLALGRAPELREVLRDRRRGLALCGSGALIAVNWGIFIWAVNAGRIVETSFGYFLNPLVSIALGVAFLGEHMRRSQLAALGLAALGVGVLGIGTGAAPWIPLALALSFSLYGLLRKVTRVSSLVGLTIETALIAPVAIGVLALGAARGDSHFGADRATSALLVFSGPITAFPLMWFARAARRLPLSTLGFIQYLAPTLSAVLAVAFYGESFGRARAVALLFIWTGIAVFSLDSASGWRSAGNTWNKRAATSRLPAADK
jgi:chloramphenicol-sensitive protein RarD